MKGSHYTATRSNRVTGDHSFLMKAGDFPQHEAQQLNVGVSSDVPKLNLQIWSDYKWV